MEHYVGIDVSLELSSVCVVDGRGKIVKEVKVASEPDALVSFFKELGFPVKLIGLEAGPLSQWLHAGLMRAGLEAVLLETRHRHARPVRPPQALALRESRQSHRSTARPRGRKRAAIKSKKVATLGGQKVQSE